MSSSVRNGPDAPSAARSGFEDRVMKADPYQLMQNFLRLSYIYARSPISLGFLLVVLAASNLAASNKMEGAASEEASSERSISQRVESIRERLRHASPVSEQGQRPQTLAQWYNWANGWGNWRNY
jgi:hypothetical protein